MESVLCEVDELVGIYLMAGVSIERLRLSLAFDGRYHLEGNPGGSWQLLNQGSYQANNDTVSFKREPASPERPESEMMAKPMYLRRSEGKLLLVPELWLDDFDGRQALEGLASMPQAYLGLGWYAFLKQALPRVRHCRQARSYCNALTPGQRYLALAETATAIRVMGDQGRLRWFPQDCFEPAPAIRL